MIDCKLKDADVDYRAYRARSAGALIYASQGLGGYDSALVLGLKSLVVDQPMNGEISIATTGLGDPAAFARVQAGTLAPDKALEEAYRRNNAGSYAEAAEFFAAASSGSTDAPLNRAEALVNEALQKSNLGRFAEADVLVLKGRGDSSAAIRSSPGGCAIIAPSTISTRATRRPRWSSSTSRCPKASSTSRMPRPGSSRSTPAWPSGSTPIPRWASSSASQGDELLPDEKAAILDGQALQLRGTALRLTGDREGAREALRRADGSLLAVRGGKVASILWMRAQIFGDLGAIAEDSGGQPEAQRLYGQAVDLLEANYPGSAVLLNAKARLAGYLARHGQSAVAEAMFSDIVHSQPDTSNLPPSFANVLRPYVDLLLKKPDDPKSLAEVFSATQLMVRPGLAQTQAVLARELTGGTDEASRLFRQSVTLTRQVERSRIELARLSDLAKPSPQDIVRTRVLRATLDSSQKEQLATQAALADFPRFRAVTSDTITLADLQKMLKSGEAYYRMTAAGENIYAMLVTPTTARAAKLEVLSKELDEQVECAARHHLHYRERKAGHLPVRRFACRTSFMPSCSGRSRHRSFR